MQILPRDKILQMFISYGEDSTDRNGAYTSQVNPSKLPPTGDILEIKIWCYLKERMALSNHKVNTLCIVSVFSPFLQILQTAKKLFPVPTPEPIFIGRKNEKMGVL